MISELLSRLSGITKIFGIEIKRSITIAKDTSQYGEEDLIKRLLETLQERSDSDFVLDIGASNGIEASNTYPLFRKGSRGLAVEPDGNKFSILAEMYKNFKVTLFRGYATPENIINILKASNSPKEPIFMSFDIDSYDYFVFESLLEEYRPSLICIEINEKIPPPLKFGVLYSPYHQYMGDHFYGMSISALADLCIKFNYDIIHLNYNNAFLITHEKNTMRSLTPEEAYRVGYKEKSDRKQKFPWNGNMEALQTMTPEEGMKFIDDFFKKYAGKYFLSV